MPLMSPHPYKQPLGVWINSKQDGDLTSTNSKENTKLRVNTQIYVENPCGEKPRATASNPIHEEEIQEVRPTRMGRLQIPRGFHFLLDEFGGSKCLLFSL